MSESCKGDMLCSVDNEWLLQLLVCKVRETFADRRFEDFMQTE